MESQKLVTQFLLMILCLAISEVNSQYYSPTIPAPKLVEQVTNLHFYLHDTLSGQNPSAVLVAHAKPNVSSFIDFGNVFATDDVLTAGPSLNSEVIGNARGLYTLSSRDLNKLSLVMYMDFGFTTGKFNGSSFSVFSRNPVSEGDRELAVVGGRGKFRMAKGYVAVKTNFLDPKNGDAILEWNVTLFHY